MADTYHHGDLRRALLDAADDVLVAQGVSALSLRDLARRVGVSATAPYHHFGGKADLVCALADDALGKLDDALAAAATDHADPEAQLSALGVAYVLFAVDHPEHFRLAFRPEMGSPFATLADDSGALPTDTPGFRHLVRVVAQLAPAPADRVTLAVASWSLAHGLAALLVDGPLKAIASDRERVRELAERITSDLEY